MDEDVEGETDEQKEVEPAAEDEAERTGSPASDVSSAVEPLTQPGAVDIGQQSVASAGTGQSSSTESSVADGLSPSTRGDEEEIEGSSFNEEEPIELIPDNFYYSYSELVSKAVIVEPEDTPPKANIPQNFLTLFHSFGYDSTRRCNLQMIDNDLAVIIAGAQIILLNLKTRVQKYIYTTRGSSIGAIVVQPNKKHLAVGECGDVPDINIYEYPSLKLYRILRTGAQKSYANLDFSPNGELLASISGQPDYMLTVWNWKNELIMLRCKAFSQDVTHVSFSRELHGVLTSSGTGHIRFWKMARTFTGLKLQGSLGRFGKKEISDIEGYVELPSSKVLSGCESGNMLLWDGGLCKIEVSRKSGKKCHQGNIQQIIIDEEELITIGIDGFVRTWEYEKIDTAQIEDESQCFEIEPMNELKVGNNVQLYSLVRSSDPNDQSVWYAQDAKGAIWKLDLSFTHTANAPVCQALFHGGPITSCDRSNKDHFVASAGNDGTVRVHDYLAKISVCMASFNSPATALVWLPKCVDSKGSTIVTGFDDGVVRVLRLVNRTGTDRYGRKQTKAKAELFLVEALKPHAGRVSCLVVDNNCELVASGATDCSVFFLDANDKCAPLGFVRTPSPVTCLDWTPKNLKSKRLLVCCLEGEVMEIESPKINILEDTSRKTYLLSGLQIRTYKFSSIKSRLRHEEELVRLAEEEEKRKEKAAAKKKKVPTATLR